MSDLKVAGAFAESDGSNTLARIAACGHTSAHLLHWMQSPGSQTGISTAMLRFSHCAVAVGHVPSTGKADTGSRSPWPAMIIDVTRCTNSGASAETAGGRPWVELAAAGTFTSKSPSRARSTAAKLRLRISGPRFAYDCSIAFLILAIPSSRGRSPASAKWQVCMIVLMRPFRPASRAMRKASTAKRRTRRAIACSWTSRGRRSQSSSGPYGALRRTVAPSRARPRMSCRLRSSNWWQATKPARRTRYADRMGRGEKRRWETVTAPDFLES